MAISINEIWSMAIVEDIPNIAISKPFDIRRSARNNFTYNLDVKRTITDKAIVDTFDTYDTRRNVNNITSANADTETIFNNSYESTYDTQRVMLYPMNGKVPWYYVNTHYAELFPETKYYNGMYYKNRASFIQATVGNELCLEAVDGGTTSKSIGIVNNIPTIEESPILYLSMDFFTSKNDTVVTTYYDEIAYLYRYSKADGKYVDTLRLYISADGKKVQFYMEGYECEITDIEPNSWHNLAVSIDRKTAEIKIYIDMALKKALNIADFFKSSVPLNYFLNNECACIAFNMRYISFKNIIISSENIIGCSLVEDSHTINKGDFTEVKDNYYKVDRNTNATFFETDRLNATITQDVDNGYSSNLRTITVVNTTFDDTIKSLFINNKLFKENSEKAFYFDISSGFYTNEELEHHLIYSVENNKTKKLTIKTGGFVDET